MIKNPNIAPTVAPVVGSKAVMREGRVTRLMRQTGAYFIDGIWLWDKNGRIPNSFSMGSDIIATIPADATPYQEWKIVGEVMGWPEQPGQAEPDRLSELETALLRLLVIVEAMQRRKDKQPVDLSNPDCIAWRDQPKRWQKAMRRHFKAGGKVQAFSGDLWYDIAGSVWDDHRAYRAAPQAEESGE